MNDLADFIRAHRKAKGLTQARLAGRIGVSPQRVQQYEAGDWTPSDAWYKLPDALEISREEFLAAVPEALRVKLPNAPKSRGTRLAAIDGPSNYGLEPMVGVTPVLGRAGASPSGYLIMDEAPIAWEPTPVELAGVRDGYMLYVGGDSMAPRFFSGERVSVHPGRSPKRDDFIVVQIEDEGGIGGLVKQYKGWDDGTGELVLWQYNPEKEIRYPQERVKAVHLVLIPGLT
ncbi:helix-turn-helix domain-containing protein [Bosea sp. LjRoot237]|uniref:helix-turn-helix domain-containing protein n=1 Tax=Bosea sp. LjRoot237 TaxID=3342292 RepID=UPI003ECCDFEE